jgi:anti-repressor protein
MTQIETFSNSSFSLQCMCVSGEPWFKGKEVARILGCKNTMQAVIVNVNEDDRNKIEEPTKHLPDRCLPGNSKNIVFINESGLYSLIMRSEKPEGKTFKKWVTSEVLPKIRKTGSYSVPGHYSSNEISWKEVFEKAFWAGGHPALQSH